MNEMKIGWLFPDTLFLHGDRGNIKAIERYLEAGNLQYETVKVDFDSKDFNPEGYDFIFCPPGEISSFPAVIEWLQPYKEGLNQFIKSGKPLLVTGTSVAMWCKSIKRTDGSVIEGLGFIDADAIEDESVYGDDNYYKATYNGKEFELVGIQIQMNHYENNGATPFGNLIYGYGNNGKTRDEGFALNNAIFTNSLAPLLVCNPWLAQEIIQVMAKNKGLEKVEFAGNNELEEKSLDAKKEFILNKATNLTNCK